ncbi:respiratory chain complex I subunit 1 family protein [Baekduia soli]|uniref:respiratory chain complex I subunit 1 family protein n=1 Tax=Baekduia soli TaxID=496014 RepID=UPI0016527A69|nr:NADH-quinone oxidoreductase subunit H [Baekduia soli]
MTGADAGAGVAQVAGGLVLAPLAAGWIQHLKGRLQGRRGPSALQPYRDLRRLWGKSAVQPSAAGPLYRAAPAVVAAALLVAALVVPVGGRAADWGVGHDALVVIGLLALARGALALSAWDTGAGFGLLGAGRDLTFAVFVEGVLLLVVLLAGRAVGGSTDLVALSGAAAGGAPWHSAAHWCAGAAFALVALAETGRQPVDNPDTHLELTMVHEGPLLEYAGRDLACLQWAAAARLWLMLVLAAGLFAPTTGPFTARLALAAATVAVLCVAIALTETALAKMRILRVPVFVGGAGALCLIGLAGSLVQGA